VPYASGRNPPDNRRLIAQLRNIYKDMKGEIISRLKEFADILPQKDDDEIFCELAFCILTPQSRAKSCWEAVIAMKEADLLLKGTAGQIKQKLRCVRFHNRKALYLAEARSLFISKGDISIKPLLAGFGNALECREWLVKNIRGLGYKEASHFLRNIGMGENIAILDRHILRNLKFLGVIEEIPGSISRAKYLQIEKKMSGFAGKTGIPLAHLDLLLWFRETGEIFK
jgi:N-glycosylase/DNA lyase